MPTKNIVSDADAQTFLIYHHYNIGDQGVTVSAPEGFDARRVAVYMQYWAEEWFGHEVTVSNLDLAAALVSFDGCKRAARNEYGDYIDMYEDREAEHHQHKALMADDSLQRDGLQAFLAAHLH